ncbi:MAG: MBL fold metallo-hydrolase [Chakrabartia sp.]
MRTRNKIFLSIAGLALIAGIAIKAQQARIGSNMFTRAVNERVGRDITARLPDGLHLGLCGTGSPLPNPTRAGPCNVVIAGKHIFVVDIGEGGGRSVTLMGIPMGRIEGLFLTHFHSDHIDGIGPLMLGRWTSGTNTAPLPVHGPMGVDQVVAGFNGAYKIDNGYRTGHHGAAIAPPNGAGATAMPFALPEDGQGDTVVVYEQNDLKITAIRVDHGPVKPAVGYRFDYKGRSLVISGDTKKSTALTAAAKGADLLVHEALQPRLVKAMTAGLEAKGVKNMAQITRDILNYHTTPEEAAEVAEAAGVKQLVLSHIVPSIPSKFFYPAFLGDAEKRFAGPIIMGEDGLMFSLPAGKKEITHKKQM